MDSSDIRNDNIIYHEHDADDINFLSDSQFYLDILNSGEDNEDVQATPPKHRIFIKPS